MQPCMHHPSSGRIGRKGWPYVAVRDGDPDPGPARREPASGGTTVPRMREICRPALGIGYLPLHDDDDGDGDGDAYL